MRVIVRDGNGVPIEPPTSTGGRGLDDSSSCASVDERCLDGLLPHGGGARVDPYRARDALRRRGGCGVQALTRMRRVPLRGLRRRISQEMRPEPLVGA